MPWEHCGQSLRDDVGSCPGCGLAKTDWTVEFDVTRNLRVQAGRSLALSVLAGEDQPVAGEAFSVELPDGAIVEGRTDELGNARVRVAAATERVRLTFTCRGAGEVTLRPEEGDDEPARPGGGTFELAIRSRRYTFLAPPVLRLRLLRFGEPLAGEPFLVVAGGARASGRTGAQGGLRAAVSAGVAQVKLVLGSGDHRQAFLLDVGALAALDELTGVQGRLRNLGYSCGALDGEAGPRTKLALLDFQGDHGLEVTGVDDDATRARLDEVYRGEEDPAAAGGAPDEGEVATLPEPRRSASRPSFPVTVGGANTIELSEGVTISV